MEDTETERVWQIGGWPTLTAALDSYRGLLRHALANGVQPGTPFGCDTPTHRQLLWLVLQHPQAATLLKHGVKHFTFRPNGRKHSGTGQYSYVLVDDLGEEHHVSVRGALTGLPQKTPCALNTDDKPLHGLRA